MILKMDEVIEIRHWEKIDLEDGGIALGITLWNDQWFRYELNEQETKLFKHGFNPEEALRTYEKDMTPEITISYWKHYTDGR